MVWKQIKQFETRVQDTCGGYLPNGDDTWNSEVPYGTKIRVTYEVQGPKYQVTQGDVLPAASWCVYGPGFSHWFTDGYPGGAKEAAEAEAARLNALEDAS